MSKMIQQSQSEAIEAYFINTASQPLSGLNPDLTIRRQSDGAYWNGTTFTSTFSQVKMVAVDAVNQGGYYTYTFDTTGLLADTYSLIASGTSSANSPQTGELEVGGYINNLDKRISQIDVGGGGIVRVEGVFTKKEKEKLLELIRDNFKEMFASISDLLSQIEVTQARLNGLESSHKDFPKFTEQIEELNKYMLAQTELIKSIDELNNL